MKTQTRVLSPRRAAAISTFDSCQTPCVKASGRASSNTRSDAAGLISGEKLNRRWSWRIISCVFLPFAAGYYLSYLFRMINTLISGRLASDLELGMADLGLLGSIYFLVVTGSQIPMGMLLDRFGPRRVQCALLLLAAAGAALFGLSSGFLSLLVARAIDCIRHRSFPHVWPENSRALVSERARGAHQRLYDHAGCAGRSNGNRTSRGIA
ncbi:hypothetical protein ACVWWR_004336 [Bradyrhizobium sp. LM3.2]